MARLDIKIILSDGSVKEAELVHANKKTAWVRLPHREKRRGINYIKVRKSRLIA